MIGAVVGHGEGGLVIQALLSEDTRRAAYAEMHVLVSYPLAYF